MQGSQETERKKCEDSGDLSRREAREYGKVNSFIYWVSTVYNALSTGLSLFYKEKENLVTDLKELLICHKC